MDSDGFEPCGCGACVQCVDSWLVGSDSRGLTPFSSHKIDQSPQSSVDFQDKCLNSQVSTPFRSEATSPSTPNLSVVSEQQVQSNKPHLGQLEFPIWKSIVTDNPLNLAESEALPRVTTELIVPTGSSEGTEEPRSLGASLDFQRTVISCLFRPRKKTGRKPRSYDCYICAVTFAYKKELIKHLVADHNLQKSRSQLYKGLSAGKKELQRLYGPANRLL